MAIQKKYVLEGTKDDFVAHVAERMREEADAATPEAKGTGKDKHGHDCAAKALEWVIGELEAWEQTDGAAGAGSNGEVRTPANA